MTGVPLALDPELPEADPAPEPAEKAMLLGQRDERVDDAPVEEAEVARIERDVDLGDGAQRPVEDRVGGAQEERLLALGTDRVDHLVALAPALDERPGRCRAGPGDRRP